MSIRGFVVVFDVDCDDSDALLIRRFNSSLPLPLLLILSSVFTTSPPPGAVQAANKTFIILPPALPIASGLGGETD